MVRYGCERKTAPAEGGSSPEARPQEVKAPVTKTTVARKLRALEERYARELMGGEERLELRERIILRLKKKAQKEKATTAGRA